MRGAPGWRAVPDTPWPPTYDETYYPAPADRYWFREHKTMDPEERAAVILAKLRAQMAYAWKRAPSTTSSGGQQDSSGGTSKRSRTSAASRL